MLDGLLKSKFYTKCKSGIKQTKTRVEMIKKKRNAMQKYLRNDIADLLKNGLDINAYGRAEGLLVELNLTSCYEHIEQLIVHISSHLGIMDNQRECPEECREAVSTLMFAAARFADLPELRELRTVFQERYGNSLDCYANKQLVEKLKSVLPTKDMKLQLLQDIASESGLEWNSKALENQLYKTPASKQDPVTESNDHVRNLHKRADDAVRKKDRSDAEQIREQQPRERIAPRRKEELPSYRKDEATKDDDGLHMRSKFVEPQQDDNGHLLRKKPDNSHPMANTQGDTNGRNGKQNGPGTRSSDSEKVVDKEPNNYKLVPPPYVISEHNNNKNGSNVPPSWTFVQNHIGKIHSQDDSVDEAKPKPKPKPKSVRRRHLRPPPGRDNVSSAEGKVKERVTVDEENLEKVAEGQKILKFLDRTNHRERYDEERKMDKLLLHYSRKKGDAEMPPTPPHKYADAGTSKGKEHRHKEGPSRTASLPADQVTSPIETPKRHARANSFQPEILNPNGIVHPKLPDYDDFVARLAELRGQ